MYNIRIRIIININWVKYGIKELKSLSEERYHFKSLYEITCKLKKKLIIKRGGGVR